MKLLLEEHEQFRSLSASLRKLVASPDLGDEGELTHLRVRISRLMMKHVVNEQNMVFAPLARDPTMPPDLLETWERELRELREVYSRHVRDWTPAAIRDDWAGYGAAVSEGLDAVERQMRVEEAEIYPRAARSA